MVPFTRDVDEILGTLSWEQPRANVAVESFLLGRLELVTKSIDLGLPLSQSFVLHEFFVRMQWSFVSCLIIVRTLALVRLREAMLIDHLMPRHLVEVTDGIGFLTQEPVVILVRDLSGGG